jgi:hypothetical protein
MIFYQLGLPYLQENISIFCIKKKKKKKALINMLLAKYENKTIVILKKVNGGV